MIKNITLLLLTLTSFSTFAKCVLEEKTLVMNNSIEQVKYEVCDDSNIDPYAIGFISDLFVFREHPDKKGTFSMNGTACKWFIDTKNAIRLAEFEGVICHIGNNKWQVIDKF